MQKLLGYCPPVSAGEEPSCVLHDRGLCAVVALGLFAVKTRLKVAAVIFVSVTLRGLPSLAARPSSPLLSVPSFLGRRGEIAARLGFTTIVANKGLEKAPGSWDRRLFLQVMLIRCFFPV